MVQEDFEGIGVEGIGAETIGEVESCSGFRFAVLISRCSMRSSGPTGSPCFFLTLVLGRVRRLCWVKLVHFSIYVDYEVFTDWSASSCEFL